MNTAATAIVDHTYGHTGHIPTVCVAVVVAICATLATFVAGVAGVATALEWDLRKETATQTRTARGRRSVVLRASGQRATTARSRRRLRRRGRGLVRSSRAFRLVELTDSPRLAAPIAMIGRRIVQLCHPFWALISILKSGNLNYFMRLETRIDSLFPI
jgi:hypothetical protein